MTRARWSIAARLTTWHALTAFVLVAGAVWLQYRALERDLTSEDDQLLLETTAAVRHDLAPDGFAPKSPGRPLGGWQQGSTTAAAPALRLLDAACRIIAVRADRPLPAPVCTDNTDGRVRFRSWSGSPGSEWRVATVRLDRPGPILEVLLDRGTDAAVLTHFRQQTYMVLALALAVSILLGLLIARRGLAPIAHLAGRVATIDATSLDRRLSLDDAPAEVRALAASFEVMRTRLQAAFAALSDYSAEMAHELRTPLHVLRQQLEVALGRVRTADEYREVLSSSLEEIERLRRMSEDFLFLARAEDPRATVARDKLLVAGELQSVADFMDALTDEKSIAVTVDAPPDVVVHADRLLLRRALVNLMSNAIAHTNAGGTIRLSGRNDGGAIRVSVEDTGCGIPPASLPHVFDRYYRGPGGRRYAGGVGLGLAIVHGIIRMHGGTAVAWSELGRGTRITLNFPPPAPADALPSEANVGITRGEIVTPARG